MMQRIAKYQYGIDSDFRLKFILVLDRLTMFLYKDLTTIVNINKLYLQNRNKKILNFEKGYEKIKDFFSKDSEFN